MVDEKTVMTGAPMAVPPAAGGGMPQSFGAKLLFMLPGIIIGLILAVGISYFIANNMKEETEKNLAAAKNELSEQGKKLREDLKASDDKIVKLQTEAKALVAANEELKTTMKTVETRVGEVSTKFDGVSLSLEKFMKGQEVVDATLSKDIAKNEKNINAVETRVKYVEDKLKKLDDMEKDIVLLKGDTGELKKEAALLRKDITAVREKADVTEKDLTHLEDRTRLFQLRVLAARAREAAEAARQMDISKVLQRLDDVEEKK